MHKTNKVSETEQDREFNEEAGEGQLKSEIMRKMTIKRKKGKKKSRVKIDKEFEDIFEKIDVGDGDEFMCVLPWKGAIKAPENFQTPPKLPPDDSYRIQAVYGVRTEETRDNVHFNAKGKVVYMTAALGVINDYMTRKQTMFGGGEVPMEAKRAAKDMSSHTDDILCLSLNSNRKLAVTGQIGQMPFLYVWDAETGEMKTRTRLEAGSRGVTCVTFSPDDTKIACIDASYDYNVIIFRVRDGKQLYKFKT